MTTARKAPPKENLEAIVGGCAMLRAHPFFSVLAPEIGWKPSSSGAAFASSGYVRLHTYATQHAHRDPVHTEVQVNPWKRASAAEWAHVLGQALLHYHFCHADPEQTDEAWRVACEVVAVQFLLPLNIGKRPEELMLPDLPSLGRDAASIARALREGGRALLERYAPQGVAGEGAPIFTFGRGPVVVSLKTRQVRQEILAKAIRAAVVSAVEVAADTVRGPASVKRKPNSLAERARSWFIASYPLLGALAAAFDIIEDADACARQDISIAAVDSELRRVYINPKLPWTYETMKFVMAHELLHVGLRHEARRQGREPVLWNIACDYVINGWLIEMGVGQMPVDTLLLDPELEFEKGSAEAIYDRIVGDLRLIRRLNKARTLRGQGKVDMLGDRPPAWWTGPGTDLDAFYRRALADGLDLHQSNTGRGLLPGNLIEEIRSLQQRPIPWDVQLGQWLDAFFPPLEARRSFARASRRQASTPDIPRPVWMRPHERLAARTFGVILDTSGSMPPRLLARGLGAIASYALSRDVPRVRVLQCDAGIHDMGYVEPETLLGRVEVRGRGGTVLQPAIQRLEADKDFPKDAPILVITDGACDRLTIRGEHAFLMPEGARLPFRSDAPRFAFERGE